MGARRWWFNGTLNGLRASPCPMVQATASPGSAGAHCGRPRPVHRATVSRRWRQKQLRVPRRKADSPWGSRGIMPWPGPTHQWIPAHRLSRPAALDPPQAARPRPSTILKGGRARPACDGDVTEGTRRTPALAQPEVEPTPAAAASASPPTASHDRASTRALPSTRTLHRPHVTPAQHLLAIPRATILAQPSPKCPSCAQCQILPPLLPALLNEGRW